MEKFKPIEIFKPKSFIRLICTDIPTFCHLFKNKICYHHKANDQSG